MPSITLARDEMHAQFRTVWIASFPTYPILYQDQTEQIPVTTTPWARIKLTHVTGFQATLCNDRGQQRFRREGVITVQLFSPAGEGLDVSDQMAHVAKSAFEGQRTYSDVFFKNVRVNEVGNDGEWFQTNVIAEFQYDEIPQPYDPSGLLDIPELKNGGFWLPSTYIGLGTSSFQITDLSGNGNHLRQPTLGKQPTPGISPGGRPLWNLDGGDTVFVSSPSSSINWTNSGIYAFWGKLTADDGNFRAWLSHDNGATQRRIALWKYPTTSNNHQAFPSADGTAVVTCIATVDWATMAYYEWIYDANAFDSERLRLFRNGVEIVLGGMVGTPLFNNPAPFYMWSNMDAGFYVLGQSGPVYVFNGIPSGINRVRAMNYQAPI